MAGKALKSEGVSPDLRLEMEAIMTEHEGGLLRYASRLLMDPIAAQDVVQDAFIKLFKRLEGFKGKPGGVSSWLYRVAHNNAVDYIRRESRLRDLHRESNQERILRDGGDSSAEQTNEERMNILLEHLNILKLREKQVLLLRLQEGKSYHEIAEITERSEGNVGCILHHAVRKLSESLDKAGVL